MSTTKASTEPSAHLLFILSALSHADGDLKINWNETANDNGIGYGKNANSKFKDTLKRYGYKYEANKVFKIGGDGDGGSGATSTSASVGIAASIPATPKLKKGVSGKKATSSSDGWTIVTMKGKKSAGKAVTPKKRKVEAVAATNDSEDSEEKGQEQAKEQDEQDQRDGSVTANGDGENIEDDGRGEVVED